MVSFKARERQSYSYSMNCFFDKSRHLQAATTDNNVHTDHAMQDEVSVQETSSPTGPQDDTPKQLDNPGQPID